MVDLYQPSGFALKIFQDRYAIHPEETFEQACRRVSEYIAAAEEGIKRDEYATRFFDLLRTNRFSPGGRIWQGSGRPRGQLLNCFTLEVEDSREGWGDALRSVTVISGTGGGVGLSFAKVRPRGSKIRGTGGEATGSVSLMKCINAVCNELRDGGGRRAALLFTLPWWHPDIPEFLDVKLSKKELCNANISVGIDDEFLKLLDNDEDVVFRWQDENRGQMKARALWDTLIRNAWECGDPGILNLGFGNEQSNIHYAKSLTSTNPCFTAETRLHMTDGLMSMGDLYRLGTNVDVVVDKRIHGDRSRPLIRRASQVTKTGVRQPIFKLTTRLGHEVRCTEYHEFFTTRGKVQLKNLKPGDALLLQSEEGAWGTIGTFDDGMLLGWIAGDGCVTDNGVRLDFYADKREFSGRYRDIVRAKTCSSDVSVCAHMGRDCDTVQSIHIGRYLECRYDVAADTLKDRVPECVWQGSRDFVRGYLSSLFDADGSVMMDRRGSRSALSVRLNQNNKHLLLDVQNLLANFGIVAGVYLRREKATKLMPDGKGGLKEYVCQVNHELIINRPNAIVFAERIGFNGRKQVELLGAIERRGRDCRKPERYIAKVKAIVPDGREDVYCLNEPEKHQIVVNGLVTGQCGEILMAHGGCCCLGAIVLPTHLKNGELDLDMLDDTVRMGVRFLDNVLDRNHYPLPFIEETSLKERRIGLGVMGLHDMLLEMGIKYGSPEALDKIDEVMSFIKKRAYEASVFLAVEKGAFSLLDRNQFVKSGFCRKSLTPGLRRKIIEYGIRNCAILTIAPTGTTSIVSGVSSGVEPMFAPVYRRRFNKHYQIQSATREQSSEIVIHPLLRRFIEAGRNTDDFEGAHDISVEQHLEIQAVCQKHIDNAISKTCNVPSDFSAEVLGGLLRKYVGVLKGTTIYRDGSRGASPLEPLSVEEAKEHLGSVMTMAAVDDCPSGMCAL